MFEAMNITRASQTKAMFLHYVREETCDIFETLNVPERPDESDVYKTSVKTFAVFFNLNVYVFRQQTQKSGENITEFYTRL